MNRLNHRSRFDPNPANPYCFVAVTANDVQSLPPEFLRKGRFDELFFVDLPDSETREQLFSGKAGRF